MYKFKLFWCLFLQLCFLSIVSAQEFELHGKVTDSLKVGIAGAAVRVFTQQDSLSTIADKTGNFRFRSLPKGNFKIVVRSLSYGTY